MLNYALKIEVFAKDIEYVRCTLNAIAIALDDSDSDDYGNAIRLVTEKLANTAEEINSLYDNFHKTIMERGLLQ